VSIEIRVRISPPVLTHSPPGFRSISFEFKLNPTPSRTAPAEAYPVHHPILFYKYPFLYKHYPLNQWTSNLLFLMKMMDIHHLQGVKEIK
jgi:hypothetical protein